ncbi:alpha/beta hydrolase [Trichlorobacter ammonificans]|uniref:Alpha/beta hydrolase n=1 Tax=Trichlorobacter ammonificans TaxID=2916410 RepID=A0ABM9D9K9_9BACT|nr:alpha/beta hydrolase [Trichlorobacter ammonificans]CAH2031087.1 Alpha/beta hydrolase [Trichlorobacter ammonificans]
MMSLVFVISTVYLALTGAGLLLSESMIFLPGPSSYVDSSEIIKLPLADGSRISARLFENEAARYTVLYSHGNAEDIGDLAGLFAEFTRQGFSILAYDYHGYGTSSGRPSEQGAYRAIEAAYDYLVTVKRVAPERIILWGRSVGSGPSVRLAATRAVGGLVIESGFTSAFRVVTRIRLLPFDRFDNLWLLPQVSCPVLVMHGQADEIIPPRHGRELYAMAPGKKVSLWVDGAGHNNLYAVAGEHYWQAVRQFVRLLPEPGRAEGQ